MPFDPDQYLSETKITHDGIFKEFFKQVIFCKELFSVLLSTEEYRQFDWSTLRIEASEQTSATSRLRIPDLVTTVRLDGHPETLELACILDHKSEAGTKVLHQLNEYAAIMIRQRQTAVMPIVIYNGQSPRWNGPIGLHQAVPGMDGRLGEAMSVNDRNQIIPKIINHFYNYNQSITMEAVMEIEKRVVHDEDNRIMQRNVYIWDVIRQQSEKKGKLEGLQEGERRSRQTVCEIAGRLIQDGISDPEIQRYTNLSLDEIRRLRSNG